jgi:DNA-binding transcriptional regulator YiaG
MNKKEFAEYLGIPYRTLQDWELGKYPGSRIF